MAGAGYKLFATGDVLTAAQVNTYLMEQTVMRFADSAARTTALSGVLAEGMVSYLQDTNTLEVYDGAAWVGATGDITGLTAGTGISISSATGPVPTVTNSMATEITAKGDLIVGTGSATFDNLAAGSNGETLVADSSTSTGLRYTGNFAAGKNAIINGDFRVWQRGTTFTSPATNTYTADRWVTNQDGNGTVTVSQQSFTPGTAPVAGYEAPFFLRQAVTAAGTTSFFQMQQKIEDVRTFANQTVTFSFWAKADSSRTGLVYWEQNFGSGGSATVQSTVFPAPALTTSWQRFTYTFTLPSISGKTIGTNSCLIFYIRNGGTASGANLDIWGAQLEVGSVATAFQTATGTLQGELAACQRYLPAITTASASDIGTGYNVSTTQPFIMVPFQVPARVAPTGITATATNFGVRNTGGSVIGLTAIAFNNASPMSCSVLGTVASGLVAGQGTTMQLTGTILFTGCEL
jgi:hypothetical protein